MIRTKNTAQSGQALVALVMFMTVALSVAVAASMLSLTTFRGAGSLEQSMLALDVAESGMENAILRLLRDPSYTGETLTLSTGTATINVTGSTTKTITSTALVGNFKRSITVTASYATGILTITSWNDSF